MDILRAIGTILKYVFEGTVWAIEFLGVVLGILVQFSILVGSLFAAMGGLAVAILFLGLFFMF